MHRLTCAPAPAAPAPPKSEASPPNAAGPEHSTSAEKSPLPAPPPSVKPAPAPSPARTKASADNRSVKQADTAATAAPVSTTTPASVKPQTSTLDLTSLEQRLRDTRAIGVFTKLSLKNQVDDLLSEFRALYQGPNKHPTPELRKRYDELLVKVLNLLQSGDPPLATAIASSREAIWSILADPEKFSKI